MLRGLSIRNMLLIDRVDMEFETGLNVLTGETGAGKSILLDMLGFVMGRRGRGNLLREGALEGEVVAEFDLPENHPARDKLQEAGLPSDDTLILRRVVSASGRKQAFVNDRRCSLDMLQALFVGLVEIHGQHDDRGLLNPKGHRAILDAYAGKPAEFATCRARWTAAAKIRKSLENMMKDAKEAEKDREFLTFSVDELEQFSPQSGEDAALDTRRRLMKSAEQIRGDIEKARAAMGGEGAEGALGDALRWLEDTRDAAEGALDDPLAALGRAFDELGAAQQGVETCLAALDFNQTDLENTEERLFDLRALARKHGVQPDALGDLALEFRARLDAVTSAGKDIADLEITLAEAEASYRLAALDLSKLRHLAGGRLDRAVTKELAPLKLERAVFKTEITETPAGPEGIDAVQFTISTNPGTPAGALDKIASGGELSRFMLALKVCLAHPDSGQTLIFDEIDRGVGGATADAVGRRLAALAASEQVLVVTHSPQVASRAHHHWLVSKKLTAGVTISDVRAINGAARIDEIARMLAGETITKEARSAATALLEA